MPSAAWSRVSAAPKTTLFPRYCSALAVEHKEPDHDGKGPWIDDSPGGVGPRRDLSRAGSIRAQLSRYYCPPAGAKLCRAQARSEIDDTRQAEAFRQRARTPAGARAEVPGPDTELESILSRRQPLGALKSQGFAGAASPATWTRKSRRTRRPSGSAGRTECRRCPRVR